jgi:hypothetical protein
MFLKLDKTLVYFRAGGKYLYKYGGGFFAFFSKTYPDGQYRLRRWAVIFYVSGRTHGNLLESKRSGGGVAGIGTDCLPLCCEGGDTLSQIEQGGTVQAFRDFESWMESRKATKYEL